MRSYPSLTTLCLSIALITGGLATHAMASNHDQTSPNEAQGNAQEASQALDDDALHEKYGITPGALKRDEPASEAGNGDGDQAPSEAAGQVSEQDGSGEAEQEGMEELKEDAGEVVTDDTEVEEVDEGIDETEKEKDE